MTNQSGQLHLSQTGVERVVKSEFVAIVSRWMILLFTAVAVPTAGFLVSHVLEVQQKHDAEDAKIVATLAEVAKTIALGQQGLNIRLVAMQSQLTDHEARMRALEKIVANVNKLQ